MSSEDTRWDGDVLWLTYWNYLRNSEEHNFSDRPSDIFEYDSSTIGEDFDYPYDSQAVELDSLTPHVSQENFNSDNAWSEELIPSNDDHPPRPQSLRRLPTPPLEAQQDHCVSLRMFWWRQVSFDVPQKWSRDHLALERTFLGYTRASIAMTMNAIFIVQFYPMQMQGTKIDRPVTYPKLATPLGALFVVAAMLNQILGTIRFSRQQNAMVRGTIYTGTWEVWLAGLLVLLVSCSALLRRASWFPNSLTSDDKLMLTLFVTTLLAEPEVIESNSEF